MTIKKNGNSAGLLISATVLNNDNKLDSAVIQEQFIKFIEEQRYDDLAYGRIQADSKRALNMIFGE